MWLLNLLFFIICSTFRPIAGLLLELQTDAGQCHGMRTENIYDDATITVELDACEAAPFGNQKISCYGEGTLKVQFYESNDYTCASPINDQPLILERGGCYDPSTGERMETDAPTRSPTKSPIWNLIDMDTNCSNEAIEDGMLQAVDTLYITWVEDCLKFADLVEEAQNNGTVFNDTTITCKCFGPLSSDWAWELLNCKITPQFNGVLVWNVCNNLGYGFGGENLNWMRRMSQSTNMIDDAFDSFEAIADLDWDKYRRRLSDRLTDDQYISLTWEGDTCSDTCVCSDDYTNADGYGFLDSTGYCQCGKLTVFGSSCGWSPAQWWVESNGNNPWSQGLTNFVIDHCVRNMDSPFEGHYRKVSCVNDSYLMFQFYNDDPTCTNEFAREYITDFTCYDYSLLGQGSFPTGFPTQPPSYWPVLNYSSCGDSFEAVLRNYVLDYNDDILQVCATLNNAINQGEEPGETVVCPCFSQVDEWFAVEHMNCNLSESHHGLEVWAGCICIGYPNCITTSCLPECPYDPLCPGGLDACPNRRRSVQRRRLSDDETSEETFQVLGIQSQCSSYTQYPTLVPTTMSPTNSPSRIPTSGPTTPYPTTLSPTDNPTTPFPTSFPTTASPTSNPTTGWPSLHPTPATDDASSYGIIFLEMDKRDELLILAIMALTIFCLVFLVWKVFFERCLGIQEDKEEEDGEVFQIEDHETFHMAKTPNSSGPSLKFVSHD